MKTIAPDYETVAVNVRYGLAKLGHYNAEALASILGVTETEARGLYSGTKSYTVGDLSHLADYFGVRPVDLLDENLIVRHD